MPTLLHLRILLPFRVFLDVPHVQRIVAETHDGSFGLLPRRLDCAASLLPGILTYETAGDGERYVAVDDGVLVKAGTEVLVSVRNAIAGADLGDLRAAVAREFAAAHERERALQTALAKLESDVLHRFIELRHG